ncbi:MAG: S-methyl-5-thioribose-1-phosphate isomerase [Bacteroidetes bacterium GWE2_41_25]|nr:MAG: S-methyl-5-thioribose-1-phosphate isomerase [Bacteroidetes bacterium GWA2_40_15]OFX92472.1 MAG: S-methyl-5-thioribose-1-phosphate isomerase [Bacteroidetes bacterium GWC2_40_22]OFX92614.1 MAG: S-methyl-5-thioribose-1-phosphate isomerase [Bacteroidetes bacterium GWE2_41_25]OFY58327.1 MAG: S-methyl-5-thioribose-1-phosphate isomerase [Bacteroidetes bacterium GWF2_41_9]HAM10989.1 S-methyl-5-thioribose-1-phosphate isomerase [Bacteroidales bacterium]
MRIGNQLYQTIWLDESDPSVVRVIDQQRLPFFFEIKELRSVEDVYNAIDLMTVRGAPLIGAAAAFGIYLAALEITVNTNPLSHLHNAARYLVSCRPTAVNLAWAVDFVMKRLSDEMSAEELADTSRGAAIEICELEKENCRQIGLHGVKLIESISEKKKGEPVNILTHCNAGWLACIDYGTATAPVYLAHDKGIKVHVWVDETRPRNQGARLTAYELGQHGVPYTIIPDNSGGHLMQHNMVDIVIVGSDRTTKAGDSANKTGTYLKALAAADNKIPFYSAVPSTSIDFSILDGIKEVEIEERDPEEVTKIEGLLHGKIEQVRLCPEDAKAANYGFDITPARFITGIITEKGICSATEEGIKEMFPDKFI